MASNDDRKNSLKVGLAGALTFCAPLLAYGQITNPIKSESLTDVIAVFVDIIRDIGIVVAVLFIVYSGFLFVSASGNEAQLGKAKRVLMWTLIGAAVLLSASVIATVVNNTIQGIGS